MAVYFTGHCTSRKLSTLAVVTHTLDVRCPAWEHTMRRTPHRTWTPRRLASRTLPQRTGSPCQRGWNRIHMPTQRSDPAPARQQPCKRTCGERTYHTSLLGSIVVLDRHALDEFRLATDVDVVTALRDTRGYDRFAKQPEWARAVDGHARALRHGHQRLGLHCVHLDERGVSPRHAGTSKCVCASPAVSGGQWRCSTKSRRTSQALLVASRHSNLPAKGLLLAHVE